MIEDVGDLWSYKANWRVVTTNAVVKKTSGVLVMGKGVALQAMMKHPGLNKILGTHVRKNGNIPCFMPETGLISLPTKHHWEEMSKIDLIVEGCKYLATTVVIRHDDIVVMPRPGCGNGGLEWASVKKAIAPILDDRFVVLSK